MATPVLPYPDMDFTPLDILTAAEMDQMVANDQYLRDFCAGLADGTNLSDGVIQARKLTPGLSSYSTTERDTGITWVDGKNIYKKTIGFGSLPNVGEKLVAHGISGFGNLIAIDAIANNGSRWLPLPAASPQAQASAVLVYVNTNNVAIVTGTDRSNETAYITLYYTKN